MKRLTLATLISFAAMTTNVYALGSIDHSVQASKHAALAVTEGVASTAMVASAVIAVPVIVVGAASVAVGNVVVKAGESMANAAVHSSNHLHNHTPTHKTRTLVITQKTITADPAPDKVIVIQTETQH